MNLTEGQQKGVQLALRLAQEAPSVGVITGCAGTGKSSTLKAIIETLPGRPTLLSPTGRAAARITEITGVGAGTIHRWMYRPVEKDDGEVTFTRKENIEAPPGNLIIIDEASMIGADTWNDIYETANLLGCSVLLVGDGAQLPPVQEKGEAAFSVLEPSFVLPQNRVELTEILRQAWDSPIVRMATMVRQGQIMEFFEAVDPLLPSELDEVLKTADMVICKTNRYRQLLNQRCRQLRGLGEEIQPGEPLLVMKNNYKLEVYNGEIHGFQGFIDTINAQKVRDPETDTYLKVPFRTTNMGRGVGILAPGVLGGSLDHIPAYLLEKAVKRYQSPKMGSQRCFYLHANYGYAMTAWKAQSTEADSVLVCLEPRQDFSSEEGRRLLYTALTRAKKEVRFTHLR